MRWQVDTVPYRHPHGRALKRRMLHHFRRARHRRVYPTERLWISLLFLRDLLSRQTERQNSHHHNYQNVFHKIFHAFGFIPPRSAPADTAP